MTNEEIKRQNRDKILKAAAWLFFSRGIGITTVNEIAAEAGISKVALYKHFASKLDIVREILLAQQEARRQRYEDLLRSSAPAGKETGAEELRRVLDYFTLLSDDDVPFYTLLIEYNIHLLRFSKTMQQVRELMAPLNAPVRPQFLAAVEKGRADGSLQPGPPPEELYEAVSGLMRGVAMSFFLQCGNNFTANQQRQLYGQLTQAAEAAMMLAGTRRA